LMRRWAQAKAGDGCVVLISGEPGIGKSRLAEAMQERLGTEPHTRVRFFCSPYHQDNALYPATAELERAAGFRREDTPEQRLAKLEALLAQATNDVSGVAPLFADLLSIPTGERYPALAVTPQKRKEKTLQALVAQAEGLALRHPVLMIFEDIHWSDPTTRELLDPLIERVPRVRLFALITFRPEFAPPWIGRPQVVLMTLSRLPPRQRAEMISRMIGGKTLPRAITNQIVERTDGVPLFIEELTKAVIESGLVEDAGDRYMATGSVPSLAIPTSLQASLLARLDRLTPMREMAQIGGALGRSFSHQLISAVAEIPQEKLDEALRQLVDAEIIFRRGTPPDAEYTFKHALVQDAAYSTLLRSRRQQIHARIANTVESQFPELTAAQPELLAHHCSEAGLYEKAVGYWLKAGQRSVARSSMPEAFAQIEKGLRFLDSIAPSPARQQQELDLRITLGPALIATKGYSSAEVGEAFARASTVAEEIDRSEYLVPLLYGRWAYHLIRAEYAMAMPFAKQMEQIGNERSNAAALLQGRLDQGITNCLIGEFAAARALFEQCHRLHETPLRLTLRNVTPEDSYSLMLGYLGVTLAHLGYFDQARSRANEGLLEARRLQQPYTLAMGLALNCWTAMLANLAHEVSRYAEELLDLASQHGFPFASALGTRYLGFSLIALGQATQGVGLLTQAISLLSATGTVIGTTGDLTSLAEADAKLGQPTEGLSKLDEAAQVLETTGERVAEAEVYRARGDLLTMTGDHATAEHNYFLRTRRCQATERESPRTAGGHEPRSAVA
jgi:tetratricopeptide (TPR) repeat protein